MKKLVDIGTVILLLAAFGVAFTTGLIVKGADGYSPVLETNLFVLISVIGSAALLLVGMVSTLVARVKSNYISRGFINFAVVQIAATLGMIGIMFMLWTSMVPVTNNIIRVLYIVFVLVIVAGYADSMAFTNKMEAKAEAEKAEAEAAASEAEDGEAEETDDDNSTEDDSTVETEE